MFTPARIVVLDDNPDHLTAISETITALGSSCVCLTYTQAEDPPALPFSRARVIFMDLQLRDRQATSDFKQHYSEIQRILSNVISPDGGPFLLVVWTDKPQRVAELEEYLTRNLYPKMPHTRPVRLLGMAKHEFINVTTGRSHNPKAMRAHVVEQLESVPALAALLRWESEIIDASDRVVADVVRLASAAPVEGTPDLGVALRRLATEAVGAPNVTRDARAAIHSALLPLLEDHVQYETVMDAADPADADHAGIVMQGDVAPSGDLDQTEGVDGEALTVTEGHTEIDGRSDGDPGLDESPAAELSDGASERSADHGHLTVWEAALAGTMPLPPLTRDQAADLNTHMHLGGDGARLTSTVWGAVCEVDDTINWSNEFGIESAKEFTEHATRALKDIKGAVAPDSEELHLVQIRIGASCDYAQKSDGPIPYVMAAFVPALRHPEPEPGKTPKNTALGEHKLANDSTCWLSPLLTISDWGKGQLLVDPRYVRARGPEATREFVAINRIREQLLMHLIAAVARHGDRPGIISFGGEDYPPLA